MNEPAAPQPANPSTPRVELVIRIAPNGQLQVSGPLHDKMTCYALLENARDSIKDHVDKMNRSAIVPVGAVDPFLMRKRN
jgi:hypothetical protein